MPATDENLKIFEQRRAELETEAAEKLATAEARKAKVETLTDGVTITQKAGEEGRLFGSVGTTDIAEAVTAAGAVDVIAPTILPTTDISGSALAVARLTKAAARYL